MPQRVSWLEGGIVWGSDCGDWLERQGVIRSSLVHWHGVVRSSPVPCTDIAGCIGAERWSPVHQHGVDGSSLVHWHNRIITGALVRAITSLPVC